MVSARCVPELGEDAAQMRFEAPLLGGSELGWNSDLSEVDQRLVDALEPMLHLGGERGDCDPLGGVGAHQAEWRSQEVVAVDSIGCPVGGNERERLANLEAMTLDSGKDSILVFA